MVMFKRYHGSTLNMEPFFFIRFERRTQKPTTNTLHYDNHTRFTHETSSCVHMCSLSVFQERATTRHTHFIVFIRFCGYDCSRALESSRRRFFVLILFFSFLFLFFVFIVYFHGFINYVVHCLNSSITRESFNGLAFHGCCYMRVMLRHLSAHVSQYRLRH